MRIYKIAKIKSNIISKKIFSFIIFMILLTKINSAMINLIINETGRQQILHENFVTPSEIKVNEQTKDISHFVDSNDEVSNIMIRWDQVITTCQKMFYGLENIISIEFIDFDTSLVTNMESMFSGCTNLVYLNLTILNVSAVTDMDSMFFNCKALNSLDLSNFITTSLLNTASMFSGCISLNNLIINNFDTSHVTAMNHMFYTCSNLDSLDISNFVTSNVILMNFMFSGCSKLSSLKIDNFNTSKVTTMEHMFSGCESLTSLDLYNFDTSSVKVMSYMFYQAKYLTYLNVGSFDTSSVTTMSNMFFRLKVITSLNLDNFDTSKVILMNNMFDGCSELISLNLKNFNTSNVVEMENMFYRCSKLNSLNLENFDTSKVTKMNYMFCQCSNLISLNLNHFNTSLVETMDSMFSRCNSLSYLNLDNFDTSRVTRMDYMFYECKNLVLLNLNSFDTSLVASMSSQFSECNKLVSLNINNFNTSSVKDMNYMFANCHSLTSLNLLKFDTSSNPAIDFTFLNLNKNLTVCYNSDNIRNLINDISKFIYNCSDLCCKDYYSYMFCNKEIEIECSNIEISEKVTTYNVVNDNYTNYTDNNNNKDNYTNYTINNNNKDNYTNYTDNNNNKDYYTNYTDNNNNKDKNFSDNNNDSYKIYTSDTSENIDNIPKINESDIIKLLENGTNDLVVDYFENYLENVNYEIIMEQISEGEDIIFKTNGLEIHISNTENQLKNKDKNETTILLGKCQNELKNAYNISDNDSLIIYKVDILKDDMKIPKTEYSVFYPLNGSKLNNLDLTICEKFKIDVLTPILINTEDIDKYNPSSDYYRDICYKSSNNKGADITLDDRKNEYLDNNMNACEETCEFVDYDTIYKKAICLCDVKKNMSKPSEVNIDKVGLMKKFINIKNLVNLKIMKCYKIFLSKSGLIKNCAFYIVSIILLAHFVFTFLYYFIGKKKLKRIINSIINISNGKSKFGNKNNSNDIEDASGENPIIYKDGKKRKKNDIIIKKISINGNKEMKKKKKKRKKKRENSNKGNPPKKIGKSRKSKEVTIRSIQSKKDLLANNFDIYTNTRKSSYHDFNNDLSKQTETKDNNINIPLKNMTINELNSIPYNEALIIDNRTYYQYTISLIKVKHIFIFSFFVSNDYNSKIIKIDLFFFLFIVSFGINALFFNDSTMHQIYVDNGKFNFIYQIPKIIYSTLISAFINLLVKTLALTEKSIIEIKSKSKKHIIDEKEKKRINIIIKLKIILFYVISSLLYLFFWYYLGCFCSVYENTQTHLIKDTFMSFLLSMIYPVFINMIPGIFRISALKNKNSENLYKISKLLQLI